MSSVPGRRFYSEQEVTKIIGRAAEIAESDSSPSFSPGVSDEELQRIAKEVGISVRALEQSVSEHNNFTEPGGSSQSVETFERVVEGEIDATDLDLVLDGLRTMAASSNKYTQIGRSIEVTLTTGISQAKVTLQSRGGRTKIVVKSDSQYAILMSLFPAFCVAAISALLLGSAGMAIGAAATATGIFGFSWWVYKKLASAGHKRAMRMADRLRANVARAVEMRHAQPSTIPTTVPATVQTEEEHLNQGT